MKMQSTRASQPLTNAVRRMVAVSNQLPSAALPPSGKVFLSYALEDRALAAPLAEAIEADGRIVWWAARLLAGVDFYQAIPEALVEADAAVVLWTPASVRSQWVRSEAAWAHNSRKLVPISALGFERAGLPPPFNTLQTIVHGDWAGLSAAIDANVSRARCTLP